MKNGFFSVISVSLNISTPLTRFSKAYQIEVCCHPALYRMTVEAQSKVHQFGQEALCLHRLVMTSLTSSIFKDICRWPAHHIRAGKVPACPSCLAELLNLSRLTAGTKFKQCLLQLT